MITSTKLTSNFPLCDTMYVFSTYSDIGCACGMPTSRVECWCIFWLVYKDKVVIVLPFFYLFSACILKYKIIASYSDKCVIIDCHTCKIIAENG